MINLRTIISPSNKVFTHSVVIAGGKARSLEELDRWRLFDLNSGSVTYVDELTKSYRTENLATGLDERATDAAPAEGSTLAATGTRRIINGIDSSQFVLNRGTYHRELWLATIPNVPPRLFALMQASRRPAGAEEQKRWTEGPLAAVRGYPMDDHAQLPYGTSSLSIDRTVTSVEQKDVPAALLILPAGYRDATVKPAARTIQTRTSSPTQQPNRGTGPGPRKPPA